MLAHNLTILAAALLLEAAFGYSDALFRAIRHPVVWIGALIARLDRRLNRETLPRRATGLLSLLVVLSAVVLPAIAVQIISPFVLPILLAGSLLAQRSLWHHVRAVADALDRDGLDAARLAVSRIVGRNPQTLDEASVIRAAIESLAENFSDAVVAPALWCALLGLPGIVAYKAINTADSMIGHRTPRQEAFGWASARLDDLVNLPASRLAAAWLILAAPSLTALRTVWRDAAHHRSPNAGWPEAAMAGALGLRLAGPRVYGTTRVEDAWMGDGHAEATTADLRRALRVYRRACILQAVAVIAAAFIVRF